MPDRKNDALRIYDSISEYCDTYNVPIENLLDILEDQKVIPMIRGKATEYIGAAVLKRVLNDKDWQVHKLNLNPQPGGSYDEDVSITFTRTGKRLKAEMKNATRGSFKLAARGSPSPHFSVKCHKSRSNLKKQGNSNDRYLVGDFDILMCNVSNAIFRNKSLERGLPLIDDSESIGWLKEYYGVKDEDELRRASYDDWRICLPPDIAENGVIPRNPRVLMKDDPNWFSVNELGSRLRELIAG